MEKRFFKPNDVVLQPKETERIFSMLEDDPDTIETLLGEAAAIAAPKAVLGFAHIDERFGEPDSAGGGVVIEGVRIESDLMRKNFDALEYVFPYVATCGVELYQWMKSKDDPLEQYIADVINHIYLGKALMEARQFVLHNFIRNGKLSTMNPGSIRAWPLSGQSQLFSILGNVTEDTGVMLTDSFLMLPNKSSSGIFFATEHTYENCMYCPITDCPNRRAKQLFNPEDAH